MDQGVQYMPALDGLRGLAILAVIAYHAGAPFAGTGYLGVDLFFVLSGFLITGLLTAELRSTGSIALGRFYWRRALRLYPTLLLMVVGFLIAAPMVWPELPAWRYAMWAMLYLSDYSRALLGEPIVLSYTWSLSVEEHFYLVWPLVLPIIIRFRHPLQLLMACYILATAWRILNYSWLGWDAAYFRFDTRLSGLILGGVLALWRPQMNCPAWPAAVIIAVLMALPSTHNWTGIAVGMPLAEGASALLVLAAATNERRVAWASWPPLIYLGRLSYGMYIWHFPMIYWLRDNYTWEVALTGATAFAFVMAAATYHLVDLPLRQYRVLGIPAHPTEPRKVS